MLNNISRSMLSVTIPEGVEVLTSTYMIERIKNVINSFILLDWEGNKQKMQYSLFRSSCYFQFFPALSINNQLKEVDLTICQIVISSTQYQWWAIFLAIWKL